jgi:hypothetical protein
MHWIPNDSSGNRQRDSLATVPLHQLPGKWSFIPRATSRAAGAQRHPDASSAKFAHAPAGAAAAPMPTMQR